MICLEAVRPRCHGVRVKTGKPCRNWKDLNSDGYCKFHVPNALQCRGLAKSTGTRCRIQWDLNHEQFCKFHEAQANDPKFTKDQDDEEEGKREEDDVTIKTKTTESKPQCAGIAKTTGERCRIARGLDANGYCKFHKNQVATTITTEDRAPLVRPPVSSSTPCEPFVGPARATASTEGLKCRGVAKTTGKQCRIHWELDAHGYCKYHGNQHQQARL